MVFASSSCSAEILDFSEENCMLPQHVAIIMDGNSRWATARKLPRIAGHRAGVQSVRRSIKFAVEKGIKWLTLYAFSSENWQRTDRKSVV